ncbi:MAG: hypothetical protein Q4B85_11490 [Lachnospiraceae bacterium]|nr:hypothetical protein [Lachnospiraceae bacterium]
MNEELLQCALEKYPYVKLNKLVYRSLHTGKGSVGKMKTSILSIGEIVEEIDKNTIVLSIKAGFANNNPAIIACYLEGNTLFCAAYAQEGLIKQHTAEKALAKLEEVIK